MRTGLTKRQKVTEICFDEKDPLIHIRTHNTDLKQRKSAAFIEKALDGKIIMLDKFTWH